MSGRDVLLVILVVAGVVGLILRPLLFYPDNVADILRHSTLLLDFGGFYAGVGLAFWRLTTARDSDFPGTRRAKLTTTMVLLPLIWLLLVGPGVYHGWRDHADAAQFRRDGVRTMAQVVKTFETGCGKTGCQVDVAYRLAPAGGGPAVTGYDVLGNSAEREPGPVSAARRSGLVPVVYSRHDPAISRVDDCACRLAKASGHSFLADEGPWLAASGGVFVVIFVVLLRARRRGVSRLPDA